jgi:tetratricopeptide (TPR) repeat protein
VSPFGSWLPAGVAPVFGPPGVYPYLGLTASRPVGLARDALGSRRLAGLSPARQPGAAVVAGGPAPVAGRTEPVRASNRVARLRSARLVAQGDRALRAAVDDADRLREAIDAYGRAATIAPDLPDTRIRQALALVAAGRHEDAAAAIASAVRLDRRLADRGPPPADGQVVDPVFGDRPVDSPPPIAGRGRAVLAAVMASATAAPPDSPPADEGVADGGLAEGGLAENWIAVAWARRFGEPAVAIARR